MPTTVPAPPRMFISYSWSDPDHEAWVVDLATQLVESGIEVKLDKWDLKEGHDAIAFMETMASDPSIKKVLMICDETYVAKADGRKGGVGTETTIISKQVYESQDQSKFVAAVLKATADGKPLVPIYYTSRIFLDFRDPADFSTSFERLVRWAFDKPLYVRPEIGTPPSYITESAAVRLGTTPLFHRALDALKSGKSMSFGALTEYLERLATEMEKLRIDKTTDDRAFDDLVLESIRASRPYRDEAIQIFQAAARYTPTEELGAILHRFFEAILPLLNRAEGMSSYEEWDFDNFRFIVHELFLYCLAILLKVERFELAASLLAQPYYTGSRNNSPMPVATFVAFREYMRSLDARNARLALNRTSLRADELKERTTGTGFSMEALMQVDFVCFMRAEIEDVHDEHGWFPETLLYRSAHTGPFEIFARSVSRAYFDRVKVLLGVSLKEDLMPLLTQYRTRARRLPTWRSGSSFSPQQWLGYEALSTRF